MKVKIYLKHGTIASFHPKSKDIFPRVLAFPLSLFPPNYRRPLDSFTASSRLAAGQRMGASKGINPQSQKRAASAQSLFNEQPTEHTGTK